MSASGSVLIGNLKGKVFQFSDLESSDIYGYDVIAKANRVEPLVTLGKAKWVKLDVSDDQGNLSQLDVKVKSLAATFVLRRKYIRRLAKVGQLEKLIFNKIQLIKERHLVQVLEAESTSTASSSSFLKNLLSEVSISPTAYHAIENFVRQHLTSWEKSYEDACYFRKGDTGLARSVFWLRGQGAYIHLKGAGKEAVKQKVCMHTGITKQECETTMRYLKDYKDLWALKYSQETVFNCKDTQLRVEIRYMPEVGVFVKREPLPWVFAEFPTDDPFMIGRGGAKNVYKALKMDSLEIVAVGSVGRFNLVRGRVVTGIEGISKMEKYALEHLDHPNILTGRVFDYKGKKDNDNDLKSIWKRAVVSPWFSGGSLLHAAPYLNWLEKVQIAFDVLSALNYLHSKTNKEDGSGEWVHLDVKPQNILLGKDEDGELRAVLGDLGFSGPLSTRRSFKGGTKEFMAPEIFDLRGVGTYTDIWAAGITLYWLFYNDLPHAAFWRESVQKDWIWYLMGKMLMEDVKERWPAAKCMRFIYANLQKKRS